MYRGHFLQAHSTIHLCRVYNNSSHVLIQLLIIYSYIVSCYYCYYLHSFSKNHNLFL